MYQTNGMNTFSQILVKELLTTKEGKKAVQEFKQKTVEGINLNINYLRSKGLMAEQFYKNSEPVGIFAIVNKSEAELLANHIGSVRLSYFTKQNLEADKFARICVSMPSDEFKWFFDQMK